MRKLDQLDTESRLQLAELFFQVPTFATHLFQDWSATLTPNHMLSLLLVMTENQVGLAITLLPLSFLL